MIAKSERRIKEDIEYAECLRLMNTSIREMEENGKVQDDQHVSVLYSRGS